jgi:hypothetical protein
MFTRPYRRLTKIKFGKALTKVREGSYDRLARNAVCRLPGYASVKPEQPVAETTGSRAFCFGDIMARNERCGEQFARWTFVTGYGTSSGKEYTSMASQSLGIAAIERYRLDSEKNAQTVIGEGVKIAFDYTTIAFNAHAERSSLQDRVSMAPEHLDRFMWMCLKRSSIGYQYYLRFASPEEANRLTLQVMYRGFRWPGDALDPREREHLRELLEKDLWPDVLMQWLLRAGFSSTRWSELYSWSESIERLFDLPSIRKKWETALQTHLDGVEKEAQRELLVELRVKKSVAEALAMLRQGAETEKTTRPSKKLGRTPKLPLEFVNFVGTLWLERDRGEAKTTQYRKIALAIDAKGWGPPAKYLEGEWAEKLNTYNSHHSNSKPGPVKTWAQLVATANKHQLLRGMVKLLSRCAGRVRTGSTGLSGN